MRPIPDSVFQKLFDLVFDLIKEVNAGLGNAVRSRVGCIETKKYLYKVQVWIEKNEEPEDGK